jgi:hypothetical protein
MERKNIIVENIYYLLDKKNKTAKVIDLGYGHIGEPIEVILPKFIRYRFRKYKVTEIGDWAFRGRRSLTSIDIPDSVTSIGNYAFKYCRNLESITIPDSVTEIGECVFDYIGLTLPKRYTEDGRLIAYKGFKADMTCRDFQYEEGKTFEIEGKIRLCNRGFHACTNPLDVFNYYDGKIGEDIVIHEVFLSGDIDEDNDDDSKVCASKIEIGRRLSLKDINNIINCK